MQKNEGERKFIAIIHPAEEGGYWAEVPALPGCVSQGDTMAEVKANIKEAAEGWLEARAELEAQAKVQALSHNAIPFEIAL